MLGRLFRRRGFPVAAEASGPDEADDEAGDDVEDGYDIVGADERVERCRQILIGYSQTLGGSIIDLHADNYYERSLELRFRYQGEAARVQLAPLGGDLAVERKANFRCAALYLYRRDDSQKPAPPPLGDEWDLPDPEVEHPLGGQLLLRDARSAVEAQRAIVASLPIGWIDRLAAAMRTLRLTCVYFDVDRMGAQVLDDVLDTAPLTTNEIEDVLRLLIERATALPLQPGT